LEKGAKKSGQSLGIVKKTK